MSTHQADQQTIRAAIGGLNGFAAWLAGQPSSYIQGGFSYSTDELTEQLAGLQKHWELVRELLPTGMRTVPDRIIKNRIETPHVLDREHDRVHYIADTINPAVNSLKACADRLTTMLDNNPSHRNAEIRQEPLIEIAEEVDTLVHDPLVMANFRTMFEKWCAEERACKAQHDEWEASREKYALRIVKNARLRDRKAGRPKKGYVWEHFGFIGDNLRRPGFSKAKLGEAVEGWAPPELLVNRCPEVRHLIPLPGRPLSLAERYTLLSAIRDFFSKGEETIGPLHGPKYDADKQVKRLKKSIPYYCLYRCVEELGPSDHRHLRRYLTDVKDDLKASGLINGDKTGAIDALVAKDSPKADESGYKHTIDVHPGCVVMDGKHTLGGVPAQDLTLLCRNRDGTVPLDIAASRMSELKRQLKRKDCDWLAQAISDRQRDAGYLFKTPERTQITVHS